MCNDFKTTFLGTSAASISPGVPTSAFLVELGETKVIVDAGIGVASQLSKTGLNADMLDAVLITHWHFDHFAGLPALLRSRNNPSPLPVYGPKPPFYVSAVIRSLFPAINRSFTEVTDNHQLPYSDLTADSFPTSHGIPTVGWTLTENSSESRRIVFSGDTMPSRTVIQSAAEADLLIYEATYLERHRSRAVRTKHSTVSEAANIALKSNVKRLALTHTSSRYTSREIRREYEGIFPSAVVPKPNTSISV